MGGGGGKISFFTNKYQFFQKIIFFKGKICLHWRGQLSSCLLPPSPEYTSVKDAFNVTLAQQTAQLIGTPNMAIVVG